MRTVAAVVSIDGEQKVLGLNLEHHAEGEERTAALQHVLESIALAALGPEVRVLLTRPRPVVAPPAAEVAAWQAALAQLQHVEQRMQGLQQQGLQQQDNLFNLYAGDFRRERG